MHEQREPGEDRTTNLDKLFAMIRSVSHKVDNLATELNTLQQDLNTLQQDLTQHMDEEEVTLKDHAVELTKLNRLIKAFPEDPHGEPGIEEHYDDHFERRSNKGWIKDLKFEIVKLFIMSLMSAVLFIFVLGLRDYIHPPTVTTVQEK